MRNRLDSKVSTQQKGNVGRSSGKQPTFMGVTANAGHTRKLEVEIADGMPCFLEERKYEGAATKAKRSEPAMLELFTGLQATVDMQWYIIVLSKGAQLRYGVNDAIWEIGRTAYQLSKEPFQLDN